MLIMVRSLTSWTSVKKLNKLKQEGLKMFTKTDSGLLHIIWIEFDNKSVGTDLRKYFQASLAGSAGCQDTNIFIVGR